MDWAEKFRRQQRQKASLLSSSNTNYPQITSKLSTWEKERERQQDKREEETGVGVGVITMRSEKLELN